jgi:IS30 family transposase
MGYPTRIYYTEKDKASICDSWQKGESLNAIARHFGRSHSSIQGILSRTGSIRPLPRRRSRHHTQKTPDHGRIQNRLKRVASTGCISMMIR